MFLIIGVVMVVVVSIVVGNVGRSVMLNVVVGPPLGLTIALGWAQGRELDRITTWWGVVLCAVAGVVYMEMARRSDRDLVATIKYKRTVKARRTQVRRNLRMKRYSAEVSAK